MPNLTAFFARLARPQIFHSVAVVALVAACNAVPGTTPGTSPGGSHPPTTQSPTGSPTAEPTPTLAPNPTFGQGQIEHPTGATDIVLRMDIGGGFVPMEYFATQAPTFTLYGDGTVIYQSGPGPAFGESGAMPPWVMGKMTEEGVQALLEFALGPGRLANAKPQYDNPMIADAPTTTFVLNAAGSEKVVSIYGLSEAMPGVPDGADRAGFLQLSYLLNNFQAEADAGTVTDLQPYDADLYRVTMFDGFGEPTAEPQDWPWADLDVDDFPRGDEPGAIRLMTRDEVTQLVEVPNGGAQAVWVRAPDDQLVQFAVRPLLPDEEAAVEGL